MARAVPLVVLLALLAGCSNDADRSFEAGEHTLTLSQPRAAHRATLLVDGRVLITGGCTEPGCGGAEAGRRSEIYDGGRLVPGPTMLTPRVSGTATLLPDGRVLLVGGYPGEGQPPTAEAEVFDPGTDEFTAVGKLTVARADHTATLLPDGRVLIAGGFDATGRALDSSELFDPASDQFHAGPDLLAARAAHGAVAVGRSIVLVGGTERTAALRTTEVFENGHWRTGPSLRTPRVKHGVVALDDTTLFVVGGTKETDGHRRLDTTEILDLRGAKATAGPELTHGEYKLDGALARLPDGRVVVPSGHSLEVFDPRTGRLTALDVSTYDARSFRTATVVDGARVLIAGGYDDAIVPTDQATVVTIPET